MTTEKEVELMRMRCELLNLSTAQIVVEGKIGVLENELGIDDGLETIVKKQNQTLLHIKAELEFIKQHPFDLVLVGGSIENMSRVIEGQTEPIIDEGCVGCCKVVDVAAKLQKELDEYKEAVWLERIDHKSVLKTVNQYHHAKIKDLEDDNSSRGETIDRMAKKWSRDRATIKSFKAIETRETDRLHKTILDMDVTISDLMDNDRRINGFLDEYRVTVDNRDKTIEELHTKIWELERTLPANFWDVVAGRDATIRKQRTTIEDYKETIHIERMDRVTEKESINRKFCEDLRKLNATIEELKDGNIEDLHELYDIDKEEIDQLKNVISARESSIDECEKIGRHNVNVLKEIINGLEAELSARKRDSEVLMEVVEIIRDATIPNSKVPCMICKLVDAYLDAPEGPPETPIDETQDITVTFAFLELP